MVRCNLPTNRSKVLMVDEDAGLVENLQIVLEQEGFETVSVDSLSQAISVLPEEQPALILLDVMLFGVALQKACCQIRAKSDAPIIIISSRAETTDVVEGLEAGADDYVVKPFKARELIARIRTRLRRPANDVGLTTIQLGDLEISTTTHIVRQGGRILTLTPLEFNLLLALARRPGQVLTRRTLLDEVWGYRNATDTRLVNVHVQRLRSKIEYDPEHPKIIITVRGIGYRFGDISND